ncbi:AAA family ATPase [Streptosporangiaceae bacterium NEAU-GS5]|nr:AAA family ATPase [Streptosporangiaceae bacterium NEAU-GS5]
MRFEIRVLGQIEVVADGVVRPLHPQSAKALSLLVAAGRPVSRSALTEALWEPSEIPASDGIAPLISRIKAALAGSGVSVGSKRGSGTYALDGDPRELVDAYRFERAVDEAVTSLRAGDDEGAFAALSAAAAQWRGRPYALWGDDPPAACGDHARRLEAARVRLVRHVAEIGLRLARYDEATALLAGPAGAGQGDDDHVWLLGFLRTLRDEGSSSAEEAIERRRQLTGTYGGILDRALKLQKLHDDGIEVHRPPDGMDQDVRQPEVPETMVGRDDDLRALLTLRERLPGLVAVEGAAGAGKSRLLAELARRSAIIRPHTVVVSCQAGGELQPWRALTGILYARLQRDPTTGDDPLDDRTSHGTLNDFTSAMPGSTAAEGHERLLTLLAGLIRWASRGGGLIIAFDNAELLSSQACDLLREVRRELGDLPVGFVLAGRPEPKAPWWQIREVVRTLWPLDSPDVRAWLGEVWGREPTDAEVSAAIRLTGGLPRRLCEVREAGGDLYLLPDPTRRPGPVPPWLAAAAITCGGGDIDAELVAAMLGIDPAEADRQLGAAVASRAVLTHGGGLRFRYELWREDVLNALAADPGLARRLNRKAFEVLDYRLRIAERVTADLPVRMAEHARAAGSEMPEERVATAYLAAARAEQAAFANASAESWARHGLRMRCSQATHFGLLMVLGDAQGGQGDMHAAGECYQEAYDVAADLPLLRAQAAVRLARRWSDPGQLDQQILMLLDQALDGLDGLADDTATDLRAQLSGHLAHKATMAVSPDLLTGRSRQGPELARRTLRELRPDAPAEVRCEVLNECRWALYDLAPPSALLSIDEWLGEAAADAGSAYFDSEALMALALDQLRLGVLNPAFATIEKHRRQITRHPRPLGDWLQMTLDTLLDLWRGRFDQAEARLFDEADKIVSELETANVPPADTLRQTWDAQVYWLWRERGELARIQQSDMAGRIERHAFFPIWPAAMALALAETGNPDEAMFWLTALSDGTGGFAVFPPHGWGVPALALVAEACGALDEIGATGETLTAIAARASELLDTHEREMALAGWPAVLMGPAARFAGVAATVAGDLPLALRRFQVAADLLEGFSPPQHARLRHDHGRALLLAGDMEQGLSALRVAQRTARDKGMVSLEARAARLIAESG